jgi:hypothetical protein
MHSSQEEQTASVVPGKESVMKEWIRKLLLVVVLHQRCF